MPRAARQPLPQIIAIDGPAASGKSTIGKLLADELGYLFFDTGVMYRAVTWVALQRGIPIEDEAAVTSLAEGCEIDIQPPSKADGRNCDILVGGSDITWEIRSPQVENYVSPVSVYPGVRHALTLQQRRIGLRGKVVMVGRDIGTVVLPEAGLKIYLVASAEERARRRYKEILQRDGVASYDAILATIRQRDQIDSTRAVAPLRPAADAIILDTDLMDIPQVLAAVRSLVQKATAPGTLNSLAKNDR
jgi:cytidylate kinase